MIQTLTAFNLKTIPYSESSLIVQVFSKEHGKQSLIAKGVKKSKNGNLGKLNTFSLNKYHVRKSSEQSLRTIIIIETIKTYDELQSDYNKLEIAYEAFWTINSIIQDNQVSEELFTLTEATLNQIEKASTEELLTILPEFKKKILICEGVLNPKDKHLNIDNILKNYIGKQMVKL